MLQNQPIVKVLADSISPDGIRLTTFQLTYWRSIHSELMTHRVFSRCAQSSRATPIDTVINNIKSGAWGPAHWGMNQAGMTAKEETNPMMTSSCQFLWEQTATAIASSVEMISKQTGLHKQILNRMLEPYTSINVVLTATDFKNFFKLRLDEHAQPEMQDLARAMKNAMDNSTPKSLQYGEWHLPYITEEDIMGNNIDDLCKISAARCARVSYKAYDGSSSTEADIKLADKLINDKHMSPLEHVATPAEPDKYIASNFRGWNQYRKYQTEEAVQE